MADALVYHRTQTDEWETPDAFYAVLDAEFGFVVDAAASRTNWKCPHYWTVGDDGLSKDWAAVGGPIWVNPPYSQAAKWLEKAAREARRGALVVMLTGARTDTRYWWRWVFPEAHEVRFLPGRLRFLRDGKPADSSPFGLAVIVYQPGPAPAKPMIRPWNWKAAILRPLELPA